jgi:predicted enzyme related to lactoylglutathione lyase
MPQPIVHFEIVAQDLPKLRAFYTALLDWKIAEPMAQMGDYALIDAKQGAPFGIDGGMYPRNPQDTTMPPIRLYANVDSADAYAAKVEALGGRVVVPPTEVPGQGIRIALFMDPEGNGIGVVETMTRG